MALTVCGQYTDHRYIGRMMRQPTFLILTALATGPLHGYGIMRAVEELSGGEVSLRPGTLYAALDRLVVEEVLMVEGEEVVDGRVRRYYRLTDRGVEALATEVDRLETYATVARSRLPVTTERGTV